MLIHLLNQLVQFIVAGPVNRMSDVLHLKFNISVKNIVGLFGALPGFTQRPLGWDD